MEVFKVHGEWHFAHHHLYCDIKACVNHVSIDHTPLQLILKLSKVPSYWVVDRWHKLSVKGSNGVNPMIIPVEWCIVIILEEWK